MFFRSNTNNKGRTISWISIVTGLSVARPRPSTRRLPASISDFRRLLRRQVPAAIKDKRIYCRHCNHALPNGRHPGPAVGDRGRSSGRCSGPRGTIPAQRREQQ